MSRDIKGRQKVKIAETEMGFEEEGGGEQGKKTERSQNFKRRRKIETFSQQVEMV